MVQFGFLLGMAVIGCRLRWCGEGEEEAGAGGCRVKHKRGCQVRASAQLEYLEEEGRERGRCELRGTGVGAGRPTWVETPGSSTCPAPVGT